MRKSLANCRQFHMTMKSPKQRSAKIRLERADMAAYGRLGDMEFASRLGKTQPTRCGLESAQCK
jgi:hypothetical protein